MTDTSPRVSDPGTTRLLGLIDVLVDVVSRHQGSVRQNDAMREAARKAGVSVSEMPYVVNSAVADRRITADLRSGKLELVG